MHDSDTIDEETTLLSRNSEGQQAHSPPKTCEPIVSRSISPYINQLVSGLDITGGDERKVGYYAGVIPLR
ncbi:hypothetical protein BD779DRAFT_1554186 [Infundibulicybe gibba]|nr:hypothetical protein BD779DRAFT_1554186 [Infundibulicybe gibba]